jgi:thiosulfate reductase cytochrome b subunit
LDQDGNGKLSEVELRSFLKRLQQNGIPEAALEVRILVLKPSHNFTSKAIPAADCTVCHSTDAAFYSKILLQIPDRDGGFRTLPVEKRVLASRIERPGIDDFYLLGESKIRKEDLEEVLAVLQRIGFKWLDLIGTLLFLLTLAAVSFHGLLIVFTRKLRRRLTAVEDMKPLPLPVRAWHWLHGLCVILLALTGIQLRLPDVALLFAGFLNAVNLHNLSGAVVICDYLFWICYHLWKREFASRFLVSPAHLFKNTAEMLRYYGYGIFVGEDFPVDCRGNSPFDPLERLFFLTIMLVCLPIQILTGILLFDVHTMMPAIKALGGLRAVDAIHLFFAYLLISFMISHSYFHTIKNYVRAVRE